MQLKIIASNVHFNVLLFIIPYKDTQYLLFSTPVGLDFPFSIAYVNNNKSQHNLKCI